MHGYRITVDLAGRQWTIITPNQRIAQEWLWDVLTCFGEYTASYGPAQVRFDSWSGE